MFSFGTRRYRKMATAIAMCLLGGPAIALAAWDAVSSPKQYEQSAIFAGNAAQLATTLQAELMKVRRAEPGHPARDDAQYFAGHAEAANAVEGDPALVQDQVSDLGKAMIREIIADAFAVTESARATSRLHLEIAAFIATMAALITAFLFGCTWHDDRSIPIYGFQSLRASRRVATAKARRRTTQPMLGSRHEGAGKFPVEDWQCGEAC